MTQGMTICLALALMFAAGDSAAQANTSPLASYLQSVWPTREECEKASQKTCVYQQCNYLPLGSDGDNCGGERATGWKPQAEAEIPPPVQGQK